MNFIVMARHIAHGLFPKTFYTEGLPDLIRLEKVRMWLTSNLNAPHVLRKVIIKDFDLALRA